MDLSTIQCLQLWAFTAVKRHPFQAQAQLKAADPAETYSTPQKNLPGEPSDGCSVLQPRLTRKQHVIATKLGRSITSTCTMQVKANVLSSSLGTLQRAERVRRSAVYFGYVILFMVTMLLLGSFGECLCAIAPICCTYTLF